MLVRQKLTWVYAATYSWSVNSPKRPLKLSKHGYNSSVSNGTSHPFVRCLSSYAHVRPVSGREPAKNINSETGENVDEGPSTDRPATFEPNA